MATPEPRAAETAHPCTACRVGWVDDETGECDEPGCPGDRPAGRISA